MRIAHCTGQQTSALHTTERMRTTSTRIKDHHDKYIQRTDTNLTRLFRDALNRQYQNDMIGVCAATGNPVFPGDGHTNVQQGTPIGNRVLADTAVREIDLCEEAAAIAYEALSTGETEGDSQSSSPVALPLLNKFTPYQYQALRHVIVDNDGEHGLLGVVPQEFVSVQDRGTATTPTKDVLLAVLLDWTTWEPADKTRSDSLLTGVETGFEFTVERIFEEFSDESIENMYRFVRVEDLIRDGVIPEDPPTEG